MVIYNSLICIHMENFRCKIHGCCCPRADSLNSSQLVFIATVNLSLAAPCQSWKMINCSWHQWRQADTSLLFSTGSVSKCPSTEEDSLVIKTHFHPSLWCPGIRLILDPWRRCPGWLRAFPPSFPSRTLYSSISMCLLTGWWVSASAWVTFVASGSAKYLG